MKKLVKNNNILGSILLICFLISTAVMAKDEASMLTREDLLIPASSEHDTEVEFNLGEIEKKFGASVVKITFTPIYNLRQIKNDPRQQEQYYGGWREESAHGSGFFVGSDGYIITNAHVVEQANRRTIKCMSPATGNTKFELELIGVGETEYVDLALLKLKKEELPRFKKLSGFNEIPFLRIADSDKVANTEQIAVMGYPQDSDDLRVKKANLSGRQYLQYWELIGGFQFLEVATASAVQSGNSGGAAVNRYGEIIGIPARGTWTESTGWLIPSNVLTRFIEEIAQNQQGHKKMQLMNLGIISEKTFPGKSAIVGLTEDYIDHEVGISIFKITKGSVAEEWGLKSGDILLGFRSFERNINVYFDYEGRVKTTGAMRILKEDNRTWDNTDAPRRYLSELIMMSYPGQEIELKYARKETPGILTIRKKLAYRQVVRVPHLGTFEIPDYIEWSGMIIQNFHDFNVSRYNYQRIEDLIREGAVIITHVDSGSLAMERKLKHGTVISAINGSRIHNLDELRKVLNDISEGYDTWEKMEGFVKEKARYDSRNYALVRYHVWDNEISKLVPREITVPIAQARISGRSLDSIKIEPENR